MSKSYTVTTVQILDNSTVNTQIFSGNNGFKLAVEASENSIDKFIDRYPELDFNVKRTRHLGEMIVRTLKYGENVGQTWLIVKIEEHNANN